MRVALISDLHGNAVSLAAVFADIDANRVDEVICLGDVATLGPRPSEVIAMLQQRECRCILGNHDAFMVDADLIRSYSEVPIVVDSVDWCRERLSHFKCPREVRFVKALPRLPTGKLYKRVLLT